jgi:hypothetical protein
MWNQNWGEMVWGTAAVPGPGSLSLLLVALLLLAVGGFALRRAHVQPLAALLLVGIVAVPIAAWATVSLPHSFSNGATADADEVNANFAALVAAVEANQTRPDQIDRMFLTTDSCPVGYTAVEDGYIRLGGSGLSVVPQPRTLAAPGHFHGLGTLATDPENQHRHGYYDYYWEDTGANPLYGTPSGDGTGQRRNVYRQSNPGSAHIHSLTGQTGNTGGADGDAALAASGDLEHVLLRLCVKD